MTIKKLINEIDTLDIEKLKEKELDSLYKTVNEFIYKIYIQLDKIDVDINKIELLESTHPEGAISKFIEKKGEGIHHIAFEVDDILIEMQRLRTQGFKLLQDMPVKGADNKWVCFVHPKSANGVLIELCQEISSDESV